MFSARIFNPRRHDYGNLRNTLFWLLSPFPERDNRNRLKTKTKKCTQDYSKPSFRSNFKSRIGTSWNHLLEIFFGKQDRLKLSINTIPRTHAHTRPLYSAKRLYLSLPAPGLDLRGRLCFKTILRAKQLK